MTPQSSSVDIVRLVAAKHRISVADLTGRGRSKKLWAARREAVVSLRHEGFSFGRIAHVMKRGKTTVEHYLNPRNDLEKSKRNYVKRNGKKVRLSPETTEMVAAYASGEGIGIDVAADALVRSALEAQA